MEEIGRGGSGRIPLLLAMFKLDWRVKGEGEGEGGLDAPVERGAEDEFGRWLAGIIRSARGRRD